MSRSSRSSLSGVSFATLLTVLFIGLKLAGVIHWSWWWVFSPLWISAVLAIVLRIIIGWATGLFR